MYYTINVFYSHSIFYILMYINYYYLIIDIFIIYNLIILPLYFLDFQE